MKGEKLIIIFLDKFAFLTDEVALGFDQVKISDRPVIFVEPAYWEVQVINYIENENKLFVEVLSYQNGETEFPNNQTELTDLLCSIEKITFKSIDTFGLMRTIYNNKSTVIKDKPKFGVLYESATIKQLPGKVQVDKTEKKYKEPFSIHIKEIQFTSSKVTFKKWIPQLEKTIEFEIFNEYIIEEYDAIKNYFANVFKTKKISVIPYITTIAGEITSINATSNEIEKIDKTFIEEVKFKYLQALRRKEPQNEKQLFTVDEYLEAFTDQNNIPHNVFKDENDFFETVIKKSQTKHYKNLRFLSSKHKADLHKLRLVHKPFSFVFIIMGSENLHTVWETLDTQEATYIWSHKKNGNNLNQILEETETSIDQINKVGKNDYLRQNEVNLKRVFHNYIDIQNGFKKWKEEIEKIILI